MAANQIHQGDEMGYFIKRGKPIDSGRLKKDLNKQGSIAAARAFSEQIEKGALLEKCPACGSSAHHKLLTVYGFDYHECEGCGSAFVCNPPADEALSAAYRSDYYTEAQKVLYANDSIIDYRVAQVFTPKVEFAIEHSRASKKTWLDIGCGVGETLSVAKGHGYTILGLEPNVMQAEYAVQRFGVEVRQDYISKDTVSKYRGQYGVISMFSVLEHVPDPNQILADVSAIQGEGDTLVIEVPHFPSISTMSQMTFPNHVNRMMHPPLHLFLFSLRALEAMLKRHGYKINAAWLFGQDFYEMISTLGLLAPALNQSKLLSALSPMMSDLQAVIDNHDMSDEVLLVAERV
ncbi:class I SAM-dependent methyltransferase [Rhizobium laguerreae]|uniref:class I SAM-dependent methyltransferase n=1 Tax=Rhizobium laguerreae TaxID=1076926 RepID=UPI001C913FF6|nr:class I SAM-dependent methyltransferase [Rhizobium laguerreae]MBY3180230.1 class I SAM-dependent methyltransferase [Rhizobium laguerreae]